MPPPYEICTDADALKSATERITELERELAEARAMIAKLKAECREAVKKQGFCYACGKELKDAAQGGEGKKKGKAGKWALTSGTWTVDWSVGSRIVSIKIRGASGYTTSLINPTLAEDIGKVILREIGIESDDRGEAAAPGGEVSHE